MLTKWFCAPCVLALAVSICAVTPQLAAQSTDAALLRQRLREAGAQHTGITTLKYVAQWSINTESEYQGSFDSSGIHCYVKNGDSAATLIVYGADLAPSAQFPPLGAGQEMSVLRPGIDLARMWIKPSETLEYVASCQPDGSVNRVVIVRREDGLLNDRSHLFWPSWPVSELDGFLNRKGTIWMLLADSDQLSAEEEDALVDGVRCIKIVARHRSGSFEAWLDPAAELFPRKVIWTQAGNDVDIVTGKPFWLHYDATGKKRGIRVRTFIEWTDFSSLESGRVLPRSATVRRVVEVPGSAPVTDLSTATRTFSFPTTNGEDLMLSVEAIPDGVEGFVSQTSNGGFEPVKYVWEGDQLVLPDAGRIDESINKALGLGEASFVRDSVVRWPYILALVAAVLALAWVAIFLKKRNAKQN